MKPVLLSFALFLSTAGLAEAQMKVQLGAPWDGRKVPAGQQCPLFGGKGSTPPMKVTGVPDGTAWIYVEYNDRDYSALSSKGGHGIIGYPVSGSSADLYAVPGLKARLPGKARVIAKARSTGEYASPGYLPPCSGGRGNRYFADVKAISAAGKVLGKVRVEIGRY